MLCISSACLHNTGLMKSTFPHFEMSLKKTPISSDPNNFSSISKQHTRSWNVFKRLVHGSSWLQQFDYLQVEQSTRCYMSSTLIIQRSFSRLLQYEAVAYLVQLLFYYYPHIIVAIIQIKLISRTVAIVENEFWYHYTFNGSCNATVPLCSCCG